MEYLFAQAPQQINLMPGGALSIVSYIIGVVPIVCYILVIVKMFQHEQTGLAIACLVGLCVCGIGGLIAFVYGWMKSSEWKIQNVMIAWTVATVINIAIGAYIGATMPPVVIPANP